MTRRVNVLLWVLWALLAAFGGVGIAERLLLGHRLSAYTSYVPWGLWVAAYIYFIGLSAGAFLLSSLIYVFGVRRLDQIGRLSLYVAVVTLLMALLTIWFDIGHMERFWEVFSRPQFHSMMAWMVWLYTAYFVLLLGELYYAMRRDWAPLAPAQVDRDNRRLQILGTIGVPLAIAFHGGVGSLFGTVVARDLWHSPIYPLLFLAGALISGGGLITFVVAYLWPTRDDEWRDLTQSLGKIVLGLLAVGVLLEWAEYSIPMWYGVGQEYTRLVYVLFGPYWYVYWGVHVLLGVAVPVLMLWRSRNPFTIGAAGGLIAATYFAERLNLVIPGLVFPELKGLESAYLSHRLSYGYFPSLFEWQVAAGVAAIGVALFYLGYRYLPLMGAHPRLRGVA